VNEGRAQPDRQEQQLKLFDSLPAGVVATGSGWRWCCPHCGGSVVSVSSESLEQSLADPACAHCRAEFCGLPFREWRAVPQAVKDARRPPTDWRSTRGRSQA